MNGLYKVLIHCKIVQLCTFRLVQRHPAHTAMDVEVTVSEESRELDSSEQEEPYLEESDLKEDTKEESDVGGEDEEESYPEDAEKGEREALSEDDGEDEDDEEDEEDYCPGGYHRISSGDMLNDR